VVRAGEPAHAVANRIIEAKLPAVNFMTRRVDGLCVVARLCLVRDGFFEWTVWWIVAENNDGQHITNNK